MPIYFEYWKKIGNISEDKTFLDLVDTPYSYVGKGHQVVRVNAIETGLEYFYFDGAKEFVQLHDVPTDYLGSKGRILRVNAEEDGLEFTELPPPGATTFIQLADVPTNYAGQHKILRANSSNNKLEFALDIRNFIQLEDLSPKSYLGKAGKPLIVNDSETGITFSYETAGVPLLVVNRKVDLPVIDVVGGRIGITKTEYYNMYIFNSTQWKWKLISGINSYLNEAAFPSNTGSFIIDEGTKVYDTTEKIWKAWKNNEWIISGDGTGTGGEIATISSLGVIKIGDRLSITPLGVLSSNIQSENNFTNFFKIKLEGIENSANYYIHPSYHSAELIVETSTKRFVTGDQINRWESNSGFAMPMASDIILGGIRVGNGLTMHPTGVLDVTKQLETATADILGGVMIGELLDITDLGVLSATPQTDENFTTELKAKLDSISPQGILIATTNIIGGIKVGQRLSITPDGTLSAIIQSDINFTNSYREKLDNIEPYSNLYLHPVSHPANIIIPDSNHRFVTDVDIAKWNAGGYVEWLNVLNRPAKFPPEQHFHAIKDLSDAPPNYIPNMILKVNETGTGYTFAEYNGGSGTNSWKSGPGVPALWEETFGTFDFDKFLEKVSNTTIKYVIPSTDLKAGGIGIKILFNCFGYNEYTIKKCFIGKRDQSAAFPYVISGEFTQVTFDNGKVFTDVYDDYGIYSDYIEYTLDETDDLVVSMLISGKIPANQLTGHCRFFFDPLYDTSSTVNPGEIQEDLDMTISMIKSIYVRTGDFIIDDSYFLNFSNGDIYHRHDSTWDLINNIVGPRGKAGQDGSLTFLELNDTPDSYESFSSKIIAVNGFATGLEFISQYAHPSTHPASMIITDSIRRFVTDTQINLWTSIANNLGIPATYTTLGSIKCGVRLTIQTDGTLSADRQTDENFTSSLRDKLLAIEPYATHFIHPATHLANMIISDPIRRFVTDDQIIQWNSAAASTFILLSDTPDAYADQKGKLLTVKQDETGLEFVDKAVIVGAKRFIELFDAPSSLLGQDNKAIVVNNAGTSLTFADVYVHPLTHSSTIISEDTTHRWFTDSERTKLSNIQDNANYFIYTHPINHPANIITQDTSNRFVTDVQITQWNNGSSLVPSTSSILGGIKVGSGLTVQSDGLLSVTILTENNFTNVLKTKLDSLSNYTHPINHLASVITQDTSNRFVTDAQITLWNSGSGYTLPMSSNSLLGGIKIGTGLSIDLAGIVSVNSQTDNNFTNVLKTKLDSLSNYTHPVNHPPSIISQDTDHRFVTDAQISQWNTGSYTLAEATNSVLGGIKVGSGLTITSGVLSVNSQTDNNFTNVLKTKLDSLSNYTHPSTHEPSIITVDSTHRFVTDAQITLWNAGGSTYTLPEASNSVLGGIKVGSGLTILSGILSSDIQTDNNFTNTYKVKLDGLSNYTHPVNHPASIITQDSTNRFVTDVQIAQWNTSGSTYILPIATDSILGGVKIGSGLTIQPDGLLSNSNISDNNFTNIYKSKLDSIEPGANNYTHPTSHPASIITPDTNHNFVTETQITQWTNKPENFTQLKDVPTSLVGQAGKTVIVNPTENGLVFGTISQQFETATYSSTNKTVQHTITHNLNSIFLMWNIIVQDPITDEWKNDEVGIKFIDNNVIRIQLTEACNIRVSLIKIIQQQI